MSVCLLGDLEQLGVLLFLLSMAVCVCALFLCIAIVYFLWRVSVSCDTCFYVVYP